MYLFLLIGDSWKRNDNRNESFVIRTNGSVALWKNGKSDEKLITNRFA